MKGISARCRGGLSWTAYYTYYTILYYTKCTTLAHAQPVIPPNLYLMLMNIIAWGPQVSTRGAIFLLNRFEGIFIGDIL